VQNRTVRSEDGCPITQAITKTQSGEDIIIGKALMQAIIDIDDNWLMHIRAVL
jgi:hypothetical protein